MRKRDEQTFRVQRTPLPMTRNQTLVLELLRAQGRAMTAYQILDALRTEGIRAPAQVYRALAGLQQREEVHRIETLNAFVACQHRDHARLTGFAICDRCRTIWDLTLPGGAELKALADSKGFQTREVTVELHGLCNDCKPPPKWE